MSTKAAEKIRKGCGNPSNFSTKIKEVSEDLGLNTTSIAKEVGISPLVMLDIKTGRRTPGPETLDKFRKYAARLEDESGGGDEDG